MNGTVRRPLTATSKKPSTIALSSVEAEMVAALTGACEEMGPVELRRWLEKDGHCGPESFPDAGTLLQLNIGIIHDTGSRRQTRHIEFKEFFLRHRCARPQVRVVEVGSIEMLADSFGKNELAADWGTSKWRSVWQLQSGLRAFFPPTDASCILNLSAADMPTGKSNRGYP